ncbi:MAG: metallophosphoesterase family protein [Clostridium sp.]|uniref:metallophosphoesterase family protein n=1 Tax=Clostridium sp. TaxID=1506 RepID=UPI003D6C7C72
MESKFSKPLIIIFFTSTLTLSFFNILTFLSMRPFWYFIDRDTKTPFHDKLAFSTLLFALYTGYFIYSLMLFIALINNKKKFIKPLAIVNIVFPIIFGVLLSAITIYLFIRMEGSQYLVTSYLKSPTPYLFIIMLFFILVFFSPALKISHIPIFYYSAIIVACILLFIKIMDFGDVKITSGPNIQVIANNSIAILWTTDKNSTSYVEYGPDKDHLKKAFMSTNGLIDANTKYHKVVIPSPKHSSIIYRILSTKINHSYQNNVNYGNTALSNFKVYSDASLNDKLVFYTLNDVHENKNIYNKFLSKGNYDFVVLNGDTVNTLDSTSDIIGKILKPLSIATNGEKPFYFVRGNHEPRGGAARDLPNYLALPNNQYYYTFSFGPIFAVVLDSGEDKLDTDNEYSGLADFENYRKLQTKWLQAIYESDAYKNAKYKIAFVHIPLNTNTTGVASLEIYQNDWRDLLNKMKINVVFSGHTHVPTVVAPDDKKFTFATIIGGGPTENQDKYIAIRTEVTETEMKIFFVSFEGIFAEVYTITKH